MQIAATALHQCGASAFGPIGFASAEETPWPTLAIDLGVSYAVAISSQPRHDAARPAVRALRPI
jgi:hypothetical protein